MFIYFDYILFAGVHGAGQNVWPYCFMYLLAKVFGLLIKINDKVWVTSSSYSSWCWPVFISSVFVTLGYLLLTLSYQDIFKSLFKYCTIWTSCLKHSEISCRSCFQGCICVKSFILQEKNKHLFCNAMKFKCLQKLFMRIYIL